MELSNYREGEVRLLTEESCEHRRHEGSDPPGVLEAAPLQPGPCGVHRSSPDGDGQKGRLGQRPACAKARRMRAWAQTVPELARLTACVRREGGPGWLWWPSLHPIQGTVWPLLQQRGSGRVWGGLRGLVVVHASPGLTGSDRLCPFFPAGPVGTGSGHESPPSHSLTLQPGRSLAFHCLSFLVGPTGEIAWPVVSSGTRGVEGGRASGRPSSGGEGARNPGPAQSLGLMPSH